MPTHKHANQSLIRAVDELTLVMMQPMELHAVLHSMQIYY
jgi:hypothetical protein